MNSERQTLDDLFRQFHGTPGCVVGVAQDGKEVFANAYGQADLEHGVPLRMASAFYMASVSKQFTALALLLLAEEGEVSLADSVRALIPELPPYADGVTLRHLLNHTSGLRDYFNVGRRAGHPDDYRYTERAVLNMLGRQKSLNFVPGAEFQYSNSNYVLLSLVIERASGAPLDQYARRRIFGPLGMESTRFQHDHTALVPLRATGYRREGGEWHTSNSTLDVVGDGGMYSTIGDMLRWAVNFDAPVVGANALALMQEKARLNDGQEIEYGLGLAMDEWRGLARVRHAGGYAGYRTNFVHFPGERLTVVLLCNNAGADLLGLTDQVVGAFLGAKLGAGAAAPDPEPSASTADIPPLTEAQLAEYAGEYWSDELRAFYRLSSEGGTLCFTASDEEPLPLRPVAAGRVRYDSYGVEFAFQQDATGAVTGFILEADSVRSVSFQKAGPGHATNGTATVLVG